MSAPVLPPLPASLKSIQHYLKIGLEYDKRDPSIAYWCMLFCLRLKISFESTNFNYR